MFGITSSKSGLIKHVAYLIDILTRGHDAKGMSRSFRRDTNQMRLDLRPIVAFRSVAKAQSAQ